MADIVRQHYADVFRFCSRTLDAQTAEDAAQETFVTAQRLLRSFRGDSSLKTWLLGIAINICRNERRKRKPTLPLQEWDQQNDPSQSLIEAQALRDALAQLDEAHRDTVILHEMEGLTYEECGKALGVPAGTVKSRLHFAFAKLRSLLMEKELAR